MATNRLFEPTRVNPLVSKLGSFERIIVETQHMYNEAIISSDPHEKTLFSSGNPTPKTTYGSKLATKKCIKDRIIWIWRFGELYPPILSQLYYSHYATEGWGQCQFCRDQNCISFWVLTICMYLGKFQTLPSGELTGNANRSQQSLPTPLAWPGINSIVGWEPSIHHSPRLAIALPQKILQVLLLLTPFDMSFHIAYLPEPWLTHRLRIYSHGQNVPGTPRVSDV